MTSENKTIAILGGTFDPIHKGHIVPALEAASKLPISEIKVMPLGIAVHRDQPVASNEQRLAMCELAIKDHNIMHTDAREIDRGDASYTYQTLEQMREEYGPEQSLCWIIGRDSLDTFTTWDEWERILAAGHLLVLNRPGYDNDAPPPAGLERYIKPRFEGAAGCIVMCKIAPVDVSSTEIRAHLRKKAPLSVDQAQFIQDALDENVRQYLSDQTIY